jgi:starch-binding outer membrane protein, SusD/RagB family
MKKIISKYIVCAGLLITAVSCKPDMDLNNPSESSVDTYYQNADQLKKSLIPAYQALIGRDEGGYCFQVLFSLLAPGDDYQNTYKWPSMYQNTYNTPASDGQVKIAWMDWFNGVFASNLAIDKISKYTGKDVSDNEKNSMLGQAYFLRGLFYLNLCSLYGETIPLYDHPSSTSADYYPGNASKGVIYAQIVSDFSKASDLLPVKSVMDATAANIGRATKGSAMGFLAKAYLWRPILEKGQTAEYAKAQDVLNKLITSGEYQLNPNFHDNFTNDPAKENGVESIFEVQMHNDNGWMGADLSDSWRWCNIGLPDGTGGCWWNLAPNKKAYDEFETGDPRRYMTLWCPGGAYFTNTAGKTITFEDMMKNVTSDKDLYGTRKECPDVQINDIDDDFNDPIMRYADVLLMYAECLHAAGNDAKAITDPTGPKYWIQQVRDRANNVVPTEQSHLWYSKSKGTIPNVDDLLAAAPTINGFKMDNIMNVIEHERCVELMGEYYRYFDLLRLGMADSKYLQPLKDGGWTEKAMYYPFPQEELNNNPNLKGNDMN